MPETNLLTFSHNEVTEALIRHGNIHEGLWGIYIEFDFGGANIGMGPGIDVNPAAIVSIRKIGLQKFDKPNNLTADASVVNPK